MIDEIANVEEEYLYAERPFLSIIESEREFEIEVNGCLLHSQTTRSTVVAATAIIIIAAKSFNDLGEIKFDERFPKSPPMKEEKDREIYI